MQRAKGLSRLGSHGARRRTHAVRVCVLVRDGVRPDEMGALATRLVEPAWHKERAQAMHDIVVGKGLDGLPFAGQ